MIRTSTNPAFRVDDVAPVAEPALDSRHVHDAQEQIRALVAEIEALLGRFLNTGQWDMGVGTVGCGKRRLRRKR